MPRSTVRHLGAIRTAARRRFSADEVALSWLIDVALPVTTHEELLTPNRHYLHESILVYAYSICGPVRAKATTAYRSRIDDPDFAFHYAFVTRFEAALARNDAMSIWTQHIARFFDGYIGHVFECARVAPCRRVMRLRLR